MMRRVRKEEVKPDTWIKRDGLDVCLECWGIWMGKADTDLGVQGQRTLRGEGDGYGNSDTSAQRRDDEIAAATDAMIKSLRIQHMWAIYKACGISTAWRFPALDFIATATDAKAVLTDKLKLNVATRTLF